MEERGDLDRVAIFYQLQRNFPAVASMVIRQVVEAFDYNQEAAQQALRSIARREMRK